MIIVHGTNIAGLKHPAGRALTSDSFVNSFIIAVYDNIFLVILWTENSKRFFN